MTIIEAKAYLQTIDPETVDLVLEYKDTVDNLEMYEFYGDKLRAISVDSEVAMITCDYHILAVGEGYVESSEEFDTIYEALCIVDAHE